MRNYNLLTIKLWYILFDIFTLHQTFLSFLKKGPSSSNCKVIIVLKKIFYYNTSPSRLLVYHGNRLSNFIANQLLRQRNNSRYTAAKELGRRAHIDHTYKEAVKTSDIILVQIQYLSSRLITLVREGEVISKLYRNTVTKIINSKTLRANEETIN